MLVQAQVGRFLQNRHFFFLPSVPAIRILFGFYAPAPAEYPISEFCVVSRASSLLIYQFHYREDFQSNPIVLVKSSIMKPYWFQVSDRFVR